jgi:hypothetical protein
VKRRGDARVMSERRMGSNFCFFERDIVVTFLGRYATGWCILRYDFPLGINFHIRHRLYTIFV